jgi:hypothetical protein
MLNETAILTKLPTIFLRKFGVYKKMKYSPTTNYINISYLCSYFTSSISNWEKWKIGNPLDTSTNVERYSFHTEEEQGAFIQINLPIPCKVKFLEIWLRRQYTERILPLDISILIDESWLQIGVIEENKSPFVINVDRVISAIRIHKNGFGYVCFSSLNVFVEKDIFMTFIEHLNSQSERLCYVHSSFYGLGGQLATLASAIGFIGSQNLIKQIIVNKSSSHILAYPTQINLDKSSSHFKIISCGLSESLCSFVFNNGVGYNSQKNIALYVETTTSGGEQDRSAVFISRDNLPAFYLPKENAVISNQRLYSRIIPSNAVFEQLAILEQNNKLGELYDTSLGVHVRHGNGERYFNKNTNTWGVKPPDSEVLLSAINFAITNSANHIENIILASDCWAIKDFFEHNFSDKVNIIFISNNIKIIGAGCNHNNCVFAPEMVGKNMDRQEEDILAFSEILALSQCCALCGGSSYFFEAVKGFSSCSEEQIFEIDNLDRYIVLNENYQPLLESNNNLSHLIIKEIKTFGGFVDGIFIDEKSTEDCLKLFYFDDLLYLGSFDELMEPITFSNFYDKLKHFRLY